MDRRRGAAWASVVLGTLAVGTGAAYAATRHSGGGTTGTTTATTPTTTMPSGHTCPHMGTQPGSGSNF